MKRRTVNTTIYDNDKDYDGHMEIVANAVKDGIGSYTDYTIHVGDTSLLVTRREFEELHELMDEVLIDGQA